MASLAEDRANFHVAHATAHIASIQRPSDVRVAIGAKISERSRKQVIRKHFLQRIRNVQRIEFSAAIFMPKPQTVIDVTYMLHRNSLKANGTCHIGDPKVDGGEVGVGMVAPGWGPRKFFAASTASH
jgi:hypothetical protein